MLQNIDSLHRQCSPVSVTKAQYRDCFCKRKRIHTALMLPGPIDQPLGVKLRSGSSESSRASTTYRQEIEVRTF
jgi:hypothetical protein